MKNKIICSLIFLLLITTPLSGCTSFIKDSSKDSESQVTESSSSINDDATDVSDYKKHSSITGFGFGLAFYDEKNNIYKESSIKIEPSKNFKVTVDANYMITPEDRDIEYAITAYIDYKQVEFFVGDSTTKTKKYTSKAKDHMSYKIPITLPTSSLSGSHRLTVVSQCTNYTGQTLMADSFCKNVSLNIGKEANYEVKDKITKGKDVKSPSIIQYNDLIINRNFIVEDEKSAPTLGTSLVIKTKKGKELSLAARVPQSDNDGILFLTLNSDQILIDGQQYLYFSGLKYPLFKKVTIKVPDIPGEYALNGYFVRSPWDKTSDSLERCHSIKLIVE